MRPELPVFFTPKQANESLSEVKQIIEHVIAIKKNADSTTEEEAMTGAMEQLEKEIRRRNLISALKCAIEVPMQG